MATPSLPYVQHVRARLKGTTDVELGPKTLILGPNGSGKSTITQALELALRHEVSDVSGRPTESRPAELQANLAPHGTDTLSAEVVMSDGSTVTWSKQGSSREETSGQVSGAVVIPDLVGVNGKSNDATEQWLASVLSDRTDASAAKHAWGAVPGRLWPTVHAALTHFAVPDPTTDLDKRTDFGVVADAVTKWARKKGDEARAAEKALQAVGPVVPFSQEDLDAVEAEIAALQAGPSGGPTAGVTMEAHQAAEAQLTAAQAKQAEAQRHITQAQANIDALTQQIDAAEAHQAEVNTRRGRIQALVSTLERVAELVGNVPAGQPAECFVCGTQHDGPTLAGHVSASLDMTRAALAQLPEDAAAPLRVQRKGWIDALVTARTTESHARQLVEQAQATLAQPVAGSAAAPDNTAAVADLKARRDALIQAKGLQDRLASLRKARDEAEQARTDADAAKAKVQEARTIYTDATIAKLEADVTQFLPADEAFVVVRDGKHTRLGIRFGAESNPVVTALSGAEEARFLAAIASALAKSADTAQIVILPERQWDPAKLRETMKALEKSPAQVIVVSTVKPRGKGSKAWTVIDLHKDDVALDDDGDDGEDEDGGDEAPTGNSPDPGPSEVAAAEPDTARVMAGLLSADPGAPDAAPDAAPDPKVEAVRLAAEALARRLHKRLVRLEIDSVTTDPIPDGQQAAFVHTDPDAPTWTVAFYSQASSSDITARVWKTGTHGLDAVVGLYAVVTETAAGARGTEAGPFASTTEAQT